MPKSSTADAPSQARTNREALRRYLPVLVLLTPFLFRPERLLHPAPWVVVLGAVLIYASHPPMPSLGELYRATSDRRSGFYIVLAVNLVTPVPLIEFVAREQLVVEPLSPWVLCGAAGVLAAALLRIWSIRLLGSFFTATVQKQQGQRVVARGPYRLLRHPSYAGVLLSYLSTAVLFRSPLTAALTAALLLPAYVFRLTVEEAHLADELGDDYRSYRQRTWRLVPFLW